MVSRGSFRLQAVSTAGVKAATSDTSMLSRSGNSLAMPAIVNTTSNLQPAGTALRWQALTSAESGAHLQCPNNDSICACWHLKPDHCRSASHWNPTPTPIPGPYCYVCLAPSTVPRSYIPNVKAFLRVNFAGFWTSCIPKVGSQ